MKALVLEKYELKKPAKDDFPMDPSAELAPFDVMDRPDPTPAEGRTIVRIKSAAVNPMDVRVQAGLFPYSRPGPLVLGNEGAGTVEQSGKYPVGSRVMVMGFALGITEDGTHQELISVPDAWVYPLPDNYSFDEGAAFLIPYSTAQLAVEASKAKAGDWVIVTGAAGGIGTALIQLLKAIKAKPIAVVSTVEKAARVKSEEPAGIIDLSAERIDVGCERITGKPEQVEAAIDVVGGTMLGRLLPLLKRNGTAVALGYLGGKIAPVVIPFLVGWCRSIVGSDLYERPLEESKPAIDQINRFLQEGLVRPRIDSGFSLDEYVVAFARAGSRHANGRVLFRM
jgi:NADPH2:quinone reductase